MGNGDPVTQQQFYDTMDGTKKDILKAVEKVNGHTQDLRVDVGKVQTSLDTHEKRMDGLDTTIEKQDDKIDDQKKWNRGLAVVEGLLVTALAAVGISIRGE